MTLNELLLRVSHKTGISDAASTAERLFLVSAANEAARQVLMDTNIAVTEIAQNLTAGTDQYTLPSSILKLVDYQASSSNPSTVPISVAPAGDILYRRLVGYVGTTREFTVIGASLLIVTPTPGDSESWRLYIVPDFADFTTTDGAVDVTTRTLIPVWAMRAVELFMLIQAAEKNEQLNQSQFYRQEYEREAGRTRKRIRTHAGRRLAPSHVGYPGWPNRPNSRNDQYPER